LTGGGSPSPVKSLLRCSTGYCRSSLCITILGAGTLSLGYRRHNEKWIITLMMLELTYIFTGAFYGDRLPSDWHEVTITMQVVDA
jgi:hypothetical protein